MSNKNVLYAGLALILVLLVIAIVTFSSAPDEGAEEVEVAAAPPAVEVETEQPPPTLAAPAEEPTAASAQEEPEAAPAAAGADSAADSPAAVADMAAYTSVTEFFNVPVPAAWPSEETLPGAAFTLANADAALERYKAGTAAASGDLVLNIGFLPYALLRQRELSALDIQFEAPPDRFLASLMPLFRVGEGVQLGDPALVTLPDGRDAARVTVAEAGQEGQILVFGAGDEVIAVVSAVTAPGEMAQLQEITDAVAAGVTFSGSQDALYGILLGG